jgi:hypothetical protein
MSVPAPLRRAGWVLFDPPEQPGPQDPAYTQVQTAPVRYTHVKKAGAGR